MNGREALAERLHEARRVESPGARGHVAVEWQYLTALEREYEFRLADAILAGGALFLPNGLDVERLTAAMVALHVHEGLHDWNPTVREAAEYVAREYVGPRVTAALTRAAAEREP